MNESDLLVVFYGFLPIILLVFGTVLGCIVLYLLYWYKKIEEKRSLLRNILALSMSFFVAAFIALHFYWDNTCGRYMKIAEYTYEGMIITGKKPASNTSCPPKQEHVPRAF